MQEVTGNTTGLKPSQIRMLERIYRRKVAPREVVGAELAAFLAECSADVGRQVGILIDRRGQIEHVVVGDAHRLHLPDVGRLRAYGNSILPPLAAEFIKAFMETTP